MEVVEQAPYRFVIPRHGRMRVPGVVYATRTLLPDLAGDRSLEQVVNVAALAGIAEGSDAMPDSQRAVDRGLRQVGSLGSGNHFLEVQVVEEVFDPAAAELFGLAQGQVCVMIHCGSRGLGHQICGDHVRVMDTAMARYGISVPDRQLACAPIGSPQGRAYLGAMAAAANYARANRQLLTETARRVFTAVAGIKLELVYDISHNLAKIETHEVSGRPLRLCVHRKGPT